MKNTQEVKTNYGWRFLMRLLIALFNIVLSIVVLFHQGLIALIASLFAEPENIKALFLTLIPYLFMIIVSIIFLFLRSRKAAIVFFVLFVLGILADAYLTYDTVVRDAIDIEEALKPAGFKLII